MSDGRDVERETMGLLSTMRNVVANGASVVEDDWPAPKAVRTRGTVKHIMGTVDNRRSERVMLSVPILVAGLDQAGEEFTEETRTVVVNREGALITSTRALAPEGTIRIINLQNDAAANFRVVGPTRLATAQGAEWGVECLKEGMNIWGIDFPARAEDASQACALLECQACKSKFFWPVTLVESEVLNSTGVIQNYCDHCRKTTPWTFADVNRRPQQPSAGTAQPGVAEQPFEERRELKRLVVRLPVLVKNMKGESEITKSENLSQGNLAVALTMELPVGDSVTVVCPYTSSGRNLERTAKVVRREPLAGESKMLYGMRYVAVGAAAR